MTCPRCHAEVVEGAFYGPCFACIEELRSTMHHPDPEGTEASTE